MARKDPVALSPTPACAELVSDFLDAQLAANTRRAYAGDLVVFFTWLSGQEIDPLESRRPDIDRFRNWLSEPVDPSGESSPSGRPRYSPASVARRLSTLRAFYAYLSERHIVDGSPAAGVKSPAVSREPQGKGIDKERLSALLECARLDSDDAHAAICLLALNGLRAHEVCRADIEDLRREGDDGLSLVVRGKGGKESLVALNQRSQEAVEKLIEGRRSGAIVRRPDGRAHNQQSLWRLTGKLARRAGIVDEEESLHPHRLRHSFVTILLDLGVPLEVVQDGARHASADTTRRYDRARDAYREHPTHRLAL